MDQSGVRKAMRQRAVVRAAAIGALVVALVAAWLMLPLRSGSAGTGHGLAPERVAAATLLETTAGTTLLSYQARIANPATGVALPDGTYGVNFFLFDAPTAGTQLWTEARSVQLARGLTTVLLGEVTPLPLNIFDGRDLWLQTQVNGEMLAGRQRLAWVAYAINARTAETVKDNAITSAKIVDGQVASADIGDGQVTSADVADGQITSVDIADGQVSSVDLADGTGSGIDADMLDGLDRSAFAAAGHTHTTLPYAFGVINNSGARVTGTTNFSSVWNAGSGFYEVTITGLSYFYSDFTTVVTPIGVAPCTMVFTSTGSVSNKLTVQFKNASGTNVQCFFQFATFRP